MTNAPALFNQSQFFQLFQSILNAIGNNGKILSDSQNALDQLSITYYPPSATPLVAASGNKSNTNAVASLAASSNVTTYITGFDIQSAGSTTSTVVTATVTNLTGGTTLSYTYVSTAGVATANATLSMRFPMPIPASTSNTAIVVTLPALGSGNTASTVCAYGFRV